MKRTRLLRRTPMPRGPVTLRRTTRLAPKGRPATEFQRIYGSRHRVRWVKAQPCASCELVTGRNHNHHVTSGGTGRKADHAAIVSLCPPCHDDYHRGRLGRSREWWLEQARLTALAYRHFLETEVG